MSFPVLSINNAQTLIGSSSSHSFISLSTVAIYIKLFIPTFCDSIKPSSLSKKTGDKAL